jgi:hypothetical protein
MPTCRLPPEAKTGPPVPVSRSGLARNRHLLLSAYADVEHARELLASGRAIGYSKPHHQR